MNTEKTNASIEKKNSQSKVFIKSLFDLSQDKKPLNNQSSRL